jgi:broad specificity phosphatase PhoE
LSQLYLFRHGQAGPRNDYDRLSELGRRQGELLGQHLAAGKTHFDRVQCGELVRQRATAELVQNAFAVAGVDFPEVETNPLWNEFDLAALYDAVAEPLAADDAEFARFHGEMMQEMSNEHSAIHRVHSYCDIAVVIAWIEGRYAYGGESWPEFQERVHAAIASVRTRGPGSRTAVFSSATPVGISVAYALSLDDRELWRLAGVTYNSAITTFRATHDELRLFAFNALPHLSDSALWSFR